MQETKYSNESHAESGKTSGKAFITLVLNFDVHPGAVFKISPTGAALKMSN